jgi:16S rRNA (cytidine1402-2'-O)-methyltransferase
MPRVTLVPTPIGNLEDITLRAIRILKEAGLIAAEDTRTSGVLLKKYEISNATTSLHTHNEHGKVSQLLDKVEKEDLHLAVITDAGTPGISDPGFLLVREARARGIPVETLPGPTAFVPALVNSGIPCDRFVFEGFLPAKKGRKTRIESLTEESRTMVFYESPHRLLRTLTDFIATFGQQRQVSVSRELTKIHEENVTGTLAEVKEHFIHGKIKGEIVIVLAGKV